MAKTNVDADDITISVYTGDTDKTVSSIDSIITVLENLNTMVIATTGHIRDLENSLRDLGGLSKSLENISIDVNTKQTRNAKVNGADISKKEQNLYDELTDATGAYFKEYEQAIPLFDELENRSNSMFQDMETGAKETTGAMSALNDELEKSADATTSTRNERFKDILTNRRQERYRNINLDKDLDKGAFALLRKNAESAFSSINRMAKTSMRVLGTTFKMFTAPTRWIGKGIVDIGKAITKPLQKISLGLLGV